MWVHKNKTLTHFNEKNLAFIKFIMSLLFIFFLLLCFHFLKELIQKTEETPSEPVQETARIYFPKISF